MQTLIYKKHYFIKQGINIMLCKYSFLKIGNVKKSQCIVSLSVSWWRYYIILPNVNLGKNWIKVTGHLSGLFVTTSSEPIPIKKKKEGGSKTPRSSCASDKTLISNYFWPQYHLRASLQRSVLYSTCRAEENVVPWPNPSGPAPAHAVFFTMYLFHICFFAALP